MEDPKFLTFFCKFMKKEQLKVQPLDEVDIHNYQLVFKDIKSKENMLSKKELEVCESVEFSDEIEIKDNENTTIHMFIYKSQNNLQVLHSKISQQSIKDVENKLYIKVNNLILQRVKNDSSTQFIKDHQLILDIPEIQKKEESNKERYTIISKLLSHFIYKGKDQYFRQDNQICIQINFNKQNNMSQVLSTKIIQQIDSYTHFIIENTHLEKNKISVQEKLKQISEDKKKKKFVCGIYVLQEKQKQIYLIESISYDNGEYQLLTSDSQNNQQKIKLDPKFCFKIEHKSNLTYLKENKKQSKVQDYMKNQMINAQTNFHSSLSLLDIVVQPQPYYFNYQKGQRGYIFDPPVLRFSGFRAYQWDPSQKLNNEYFGFNKYNCMSQNIEIDNWVLIMNETNYDVVHRFLSIFVKFADALGVIVKQPQIIELNTYTRENWENKLSSKFSENNQNEFNFVFSLTQNMKNQKQNQNNQISNEDLNKALLKYLTLEQHCIHQNLDIEQISSFNQESVKIIQNAFIQILIKLGYPIWTVQLPQQFADGTMVIGIDSSKNFVIIDGKFEEVISVVSSTNSLQSAFYSVSYLRNSGDSKLEKIILESIKQFEKNENKQKPQNVIVYRYKQENDQSDQSEAEMNTIIKIMKDKNIRLTFMEVNIDEYFKFFEPSNKKFQTPKAGSTLVFQNKYFYMYPDTIDPNIINSTTKFTIINFPKKEFDCQDCQDLAKFTFYQCFNYYNVQGPIKIPANLKYAQDLSSLTMKVKRDISQIKSLQNKLFYI